MEIFRNHPGNAPASLANRLLVAVRRFRGNELRDDDQSFLVLRQFEG